MFRLLDRQEEGATVARSENSESISAKSLANLRVLVYLCGWKNINGFSGCLPKNHSMNDFISVGLMGVVAIAKISVPSHKISCLLKSPL